MRRDKKHFLREAMAGIMIELCDVNYIIKGKKIIDNVNLKINKGDKIAICGPNGAGKSTLINLILNIPNLSFERHTHKITGSINNTLFDIDTYQDIKVCLQNSHFSYNLYLKVKELLNLCFDGNIPMDLIREFDLENKLDNLVRTLSGGEYQKLNIILTIASKPKVIFLDEITTGLDYETQKKIIQYIKNYISNKEITLILVSHYLEEVKELADKICFLNKGKVVECGSMSQLFQKHSIENSDICKLYEEVIPDEKDI